MAISGQQTENNKRAQFFYQGAGHLGVQLTILTPARVKGIDFQKRCKKQGHYLRVLPSFSNPKKPATGLFIAYRLSCTVFVLGVPGSIL